MQGATRCWMYVRVGYGGGKKRVAEQFRRCWLACRAPRCATTLGHDLRAVKFHTEKSRSSTIKNINKLALVRCAVLRCPSHFGNLSRTNETSVHLAAVDGCQAQWESV